MTTPTGGWARLREAMERLHALTDPRGIEVALVGGCVRDRLLGRASGARNVDLAIARDAIPTARALAASLRGTAVVLDEATRTVRVIVGEEPDRLELDLSEFRGPDLEADLRRRDFTVNAIGIRLGEWLTDATQPRRVVDPLGGREALAQRRLVACFHDTFREDPLRILRAYRFAATLEFQLDPSLRPLIAASVGRLDGVSGERLRDELLAICETGRAGWAMSALEEVGALEQIMPELAPGRGMAQGGYHHLDVLAHGLETVRQADALLADFDGFSPRLQDRLREHCGEALVPRRTRAGLIKLAGLLHDVGKPATRSVHPDGEIWFLGHEHAGAELAARIAARLRLSHREGQMVCALIRHHLRPGFLSREPELTRRAVYRFYKDLGDHGPACVLTWWSDRLATRGPVSRVEQIPEQRARTEALLEPYFFQPEEVVRPPRLLDGHRLMQVFRLEPGPEVGRLLALVEEAQAEGRVGTPEEALALLRERLTPREG